MGLFNGGTSVCGLLNKVLYYVKEIKIRSNSNKKGTNLGFRRLNHVNFGFCFVCSRFMQDIWESIEIRRWIFVPEV